MGWTNGAYPSAPRWTDETDERRQCEAKACSNVIEEGEELACEHAGCVRDALCDGCAFQCAECEAWFCKEHIVEHKLPEHFAEYLCPACDAKRNEQEQEAA